MTNKQYVFGSIFLLANKFQMIGDKELVELSFKQWFLLVLINNLKKEPSLTDIANSMGTSRQNIKKMLVILENKGYVILNTLPEDKKSIRTSLTEKSRKYFESFDKAANELLEKIFSNVSNDKIQSVSEVFTIMIENTDEILNGRADK